ncbi:MAG: phosphoribosylformylglycinamidine synthase subunit PurS [Deltaproteobacteria bacterium]|nr:phosphoribosylformylglycinamidine synthase subunit PurS [Deltaproteobacteria bacterium]
MKARIYVTLKKGVLDPQGKAIQRSLSHLGFDGVEEVRVGKFMEVRLGAMGREEAEKLLQDACRRLLANTVIEDYRIEL